MADGIEWLLKLDSETQGAVSAIAALDRTQAAADAVGKTIDRIMTRLDKVSKSEAWMKTAEAAQKAAAAAKASQDKDRWGAGFGAAADWSRMAKETRIAEAMKNKEELLFKGRMQERLARVNAEIDRLGGGTVKTESLWKSFFHGELAAHAVEKGLELVKEAGREALNVIGEVITLAAGSERTHKVFGNLLGGEEGGEETLEYLEKFSQLSEFTDDELQGVSAELLRAGLRGAAFRNALGAVVDVAAEAPNKFAGLQEAAEAFSRIQLMGRVDARILRGLRLNPHDVEKQLSEDLGLAPAVIAKQLEEGTLDGTRAMSSIFTVMERKTGMQLGGLGLNMANNLEARFAKLKDIPEELFKSTRKSEGYRLLSDSVQRLVENLGDGSEAGQRMEDALGKAMGTVGKVIAETNWEKFAETLGKMVELSATWVEPLGKVAGFLGKIAEGFLALPTLGTHIGDWLARKLNPEVDQHSIFDAAAKERTKRMLDENERQFNLAFGEKSGKEIPKGLLSGIGGGDEFEDRGRKMVRAAKKGVDEEAEIHSPSRLFARQGALMAEGLALGLEQGSSRVRGASAAVAPAALPDFSGMQVGGAGGGIEVKQVTVQVNIGSGAPSSAQDIRRELELHLPSALLAAFEQIAVQAGIS